MSHQATPGKLPDEYKDAYLSYLKKTLLTREILIAKVRRYLGRISEAAAQEHLDIGTASALAGGLLRLLRECEDKDLPHAQAAVYYFLESDDAEPDLSSEDGFHDDALVYNAVCSHLGLDELQVDVT